MEPHLERIVPVYNKTEVLRLHTFLSDKFAVWASNRSSVEELWNNFKNIVHESVMGNETLFPNWQKESWQTFEETSGYVRPQRVTKWPNSMTDI